MRHVIIAFKHLSAFSVRHLSKHHCLEQSDGDNLAGPEARHVTVVLVAQCYAN